MKIKFLSLLLLVATTTFFVGCSDPVTPAAPETKTDADHGHDHADHSSEHATVEITADNFDSMVNGNTPVLLDFWATWCGPCVQLTPTLEDLAKEYDGKLIIGKVNVDEQPELAEKFGITGIPALFYMKNGEKVADQIGLQTREALVTKIESVLGAN